METHPIAWGFEVTAALGQRGLHTDTEASIVSLVAAGRSLGHGGRNYRSKKVLGLNCVFTCDTFFISRPYHFLACHWNRYIHSDPTLHQGFIPPPGPSATRTWLTVGIVRTVCAASIVWGSGSGWGHTTSRSASSSAAARASTATAAAAC